MQRRSFCKYVAIGSACLTGVVGKEAGFSMLSQSSHRPSYRWVILYWMPYDNDLVRFGEPIIEMLTRGTQNSEIAVIVQSDYWNASKMRRRQIINGKVTELDIDGKDSSDIAAFSAYLDWANETFVAKRWAVIIVGHGGKINEVSPDDHSTTNRLRTWMRVDQLANVVSRFNHSTDGRVELLFFQNCNKATLEVIYESRSCARYTLASQLALGAPNYYYEGFIQRLQEISLDGREAAIAIMDSERADMYHTLTLVNNQAVRSIPDKLSRLLQLIIKRRLPANIQAVLEFYRYADEQHCDVLMLFDYLSKNSEQAKNEFTDFADFIRSSVITSYKVGGTLYRRSSPNDDHLDKLCGLSLFFPQYEKEIYRYSSLSLYQFVDLVGLYKHIVSI